MKVRIRIRIWIRIQDSFKGSCHLFYKVSWYFGATFQIAFEKYHGLVSWIRIPEYDS